MSSCRLLRPAILAPAVWILLPATVSAAEGPASGDASVPLFYLLAWLMPLGVTLVSAGVGGRSSTRRIALSLPLALAATLVAYSLCGFAFQYGGIGRVIDDRTLAGLTAEWSPPDAGADWGLVGLRGFFFSAGRATPRELALFVAELALVTTAALIPLTTLAGRVRPLRATALALMVAGITYPLAGNWVRGGGWLAHLGALFQMGHGMVDYGPAMPHLVGACAALAGLLVCRTEVSVPETEPDLPPVHMPLGTLGGAMLTLVGWFAVLTAQPSMPVPADVTRLLLNALWAVTGAVLASFLYGWLARGEPDLGLAGRGMVAAMVAAGAGLAFYSEWVALLVGMLCGLLLAPAMYLVEHLLGLDDHGAVVTVHGGSAVVGLLAVVLLADGSHGLGWNAAASADPAAWSRGVTGVLTSPSWGLGQLLAQSTGVGAVVLLSLALPWAMLSLTRGAVALPRAARQRARAGIARWREAHERAQTAPRRPPRPDLLQQAHAALLRSAAAPDRRLRRRPRVGA
ncbi:MAG TPA: hypothetical protein GX702_05265, partial [Chloroflexi bacterium]|nr:hypothetical protein [Chloroflexota bacterium]